MPIPWLVPLISAGISAIAGIGSAKVQSNAAKKAANTQSQAAQQALGVMQQTLGPYQRAGTAALSALSTLGGLPDPMAGGMGAAATPARARPLTALRAGVTEETAPEYFPNGVPATFGAKFFPPEPTLAGLGAAQGQSGYGPPADAQGGSQTVLLRAPTGEMQSVPIWQAQGFIDAGAQRVG